MKSPLDRCGLALAVVNRHSVTVNQWHDPIESEAIKYTSGQFFVVVLILFVSVHEHSDVPCMFFRRTKFQVSVTTTKKNREFCIMPAFRAAS